MIEKYDLFVVEPTSHHCWGASLTFAQLVLIFGSTLILCDVGAYLGRLAKGCQPTLEVSLNLTEVAYAPLAHLVCTIWEDSAHSRDSVMPRVRNGNQINKMGPPGSARFILSAIIWRYYVWYICNVW